MIAYCEDHDVPLTEHGCWACGHGGPIVEPAVESWERWCREYPRWWAR